MKNRFTDKLKEWIQPIEGAIKTYNTAVTKSIKEWSASLVAPIPINVGEIGQECVECVFDIERRWED
jgi:hypothetical protein